MKYSRSTKVVCGACSLIGLINSAIDWPICFVTAGIISANRGNTRKNFENMCRYIGHGISYRAKWVAAGAVALVNDRKSDELYYAGDNEFVKCNRYLNAVLEA